MPSKDKVCIHWFRRDLRLEDNASLFHALKNGIPVLPVFIFDREILDRLENRKDHRIIFIHRQLEKLQKELALHGSGLIVKYGKPVDCWKEILNDYDVKSVYLNHDYEPYAIQRDLEIQKILEPKGISFNTFKDQVIFEKDEIQKDDGKPYTIYTPYSRKWFAKLNEQYLNAYPTEKYFKSFYKHKQVSIISLQEMKFKDDVVQFPSIEIPEQLIRKYADSRDIPSIAGTSRISIHLRFGTVSIRKLVVVAQTLSRVWLNELCWREFYMSILWHFPYVAESAFKPVYNKIKWRNNEDEFEKWCEGKTGYPIVDAGMRELNSTGFMHNRLRMITAGFLTKHLLIDWRWGEAYFANKLLDFELSSNNGGWQWAAGSGCDAAPYFRIFNPYEQTKRFDPEFIYIKQWVPEFQDFGYPSPIVEHKFARERCLATYASVLGKNALKE
jgi:deoxyribodipyrimidine photo-lyase